MLCTVDFATAQAPLFDHSMRGDDWLKLAVASLLWIGVPLVAGIVRVYAQRSEVRLNAGGAGQTVTSDSAFSKTVRASSISASGMTSGGRKRKTFP